MATVLENGSQMNANGSAVGGGTSLPIGHLPAPLPGGSTNIRLNSIADSASPTTSSSSTSNDASDLEFAGLTILSVFCATILVVV